MKRQPTVQDLRFEARLAWLDGRNKRARELNRKADQLGRQQKEKAQ